VSSAPTHELVASIAGRYLAISRTPPITSDLRLMPSKRYQTSRRFPLAWHPSHHATRDSRAILATMLRSYAPSRIGYSSRASMARLTGIGAHIGDEPWWHALEAVNLRRPVPSGGAYYPVELYAAIPGDTGLSPGIYHHDAFHHVLELVRHDDPRPLLAHATVDGETDMAVLLACRLFKNAAKYGNFSYHIVGLDTGVVLGQLIADAPANSRVSFFFLDDALDGLLGVRSELETVYAAVLLDRLPAQAGTGPGVPEGSDPGDGALPTAVGLAGDEQNRLLVDPLVRELASASRITDSSRLPQLPVMTPLAPDPPRTTLALPKTEPLPSTAGADRRSAVSFDPRPLPLRQLAAVLSETSRAYLSDVAGTSEGATPVQVYCVASAVEGIAEGVYRYEPVAHELARRRVVAPFPALRAAVRLDPQLVFASTSLFVVGAPAAALPEVGDRWYRVTNMLAGVMLQRMCRAAAALGLGARPNLGFASAAVADLLDLPPGQLPLVQLLIGHAASRPGCLDLRLHVETGARA
jgi:SagB-type dehydrogenase family enzyme